MAKAKTELNFKVIILTQETGFLDNNSGEAKGNRSCALIQDEHQKLGNSVVQLKIEDCDINSEKGEFTYCNQPFDFQSYQAVVLRTWGDKKQQDKALNELLPFLEKHGLYPDNPVVAILKTESKKLMQKAIEEAQVSCPHSLVIDQENIDEKTISLFINELRSIFLRKSLDTSYPAYVVKPNSGTHGNGVTMFCLGEETKMVAYIKSTCNKESCIIQEYIKPAFSIVEKSTDEACSAHYRIIMSRQTNNSLVMIGGLSLQRTGSWVSNTHCPNGELHKQALRTEKIPGELLNALSEIANIMNLNQFGADVIIDDSNQFFILELNDGMGISGPLLERQGVASKYVQSHVGRMRAECLKQKEQMVRVESIALEMTTHQDKNSVILPGKNGIFAVNSAANNLLINKTVNQFPGM